MQMAERIKVLNINYDSSIYGGVSIFLINVFRHIDHEKIQFDFLTANTSAYSPFKQEIEQAGGKAYALHVKSDSLLGKLKFGRKLQTFLKTHPYDIVHINSSVVSFNCVSALIAKSCGTKVVVHSHNTGKRNFLKSSSVYLLKLMMQKAADVLCACSEAAARNTFTSTKVDQGDVLIIKNGIDLQKFKYNEEIRDKIRQGFNLNGHFVIGHVGRFAEQKNHEFIIDVFSEILQKEPSAVLLLIGEGELEPLIQEKAKNLCVEKNIAFLGNRSDTEDLYQAMDVFLFPSVFEGLGIVLIEAQACGLPCYISDTIATEVDITSLIHRISLQSSKREWADKILSDNSNFNHRCSHIQELKKAGYAIEDTASQITRIYERLTEKQPGE